MTQQILGLQQRENSEVVSVYVKRVFTTKTKNYLVNANCSLRTIMSELLENAHDIFEFEPGIPLELVKVGQEIVNVKPEDAYALELSSPDETFKERFGDNFKSVALYIRKG